MKKMPKLVIVGFPNVGKSTLFNRLLKQKKSLVHSLPGMTRDWVSAGGRLGDKRFELVDTGGFFDLQDDPFSAQVREKAWEAAQEADVILFVLDGKRDLLPAEEELYFSLKRLNRSLLVAVNKIDSPAEELKLGEYFRLGAERMIPVSAEHNRNFELLEAGIQELLPDLAPEKEDFESLKIAIVGRINVGKSSLINRLCGQEKVIVSEIPGTTRDSTDTLIRRDGRWFCLVDTAGIRKLSRTRDNKEKAGVIKAKKNIARADVVCLVMDAQEFPTRQDTAIAHLAYKSGKPLLLALNKWDLFPEEEKSLKEIHERVYHKLDFVSYAPLLFVSALTGKKAVKILDYSEKVHASASKRVPTSRLNDFLAWINATHPPISAKKRKIKIKFMIQKGILPPAFLLYTHSQSSFAPSYEKFFMHLLREKFDFQGTPLRLHLRKN